MGARPLRAMLRQVWAMAFALICAGCSGATVLYGDAPRGYLVTLDQLLTPDFTVEHPVTALNASSLGAGDAAMLAQLTSAGLQAAARVSYARGVDLATADGPIEVIATVERFATIAGASSSFAADVRRLDLVAGAVPESTGPLGDAAHATSIVRTAPNGIDAVSVTLEWRVANLVNVVVVRGRDGGTRLSDALAIADRQNADERLSVTPS